MKTLAFLFMTSLLVASEAPKNFPLVNQEGKPFQLYDLKGTHLFVSFVFTRCPMPKMCPLTVTKTKSLVSKWKEQGSQPPVKFLFVPLDPEYDTPKILKNFAKERGLNSKDFILVTGTPQVLSDFAAEYNFIGMPSNGSIAHNMKSVLLWPDLKEMKQYKDNEWTTDQVLKDLRPNLKL